MARRRLLEFLRENLTPLSADVTVVFDAKRKPRHVPTEQVMDGILVRYAGRGEEADDVIEALILQHAAPQKLVVVSNDRRLRQAALRRRAKPLGFQELLDHLERRPAPDAAHRPIQGEDVRLSRAEVAEWLREFDGLELPNEYRDFLDPPPAAD